MAISSRRALGFLGFYLDNIEVMKDCSVLSGLNLFWLMLVSGGRSSPDWLGRICSRFGHDRVQTGRVGRAPSEYGWGSPEGGVSERLCLIECG